MLKPHVGFTSALQTEAPIDQVWTKDEETKEREGSSHLATVPTLASWGLFPHHQPEVHLPRFRGSVALSPYGFLQLSWRKNKEMSLWAPASCRAHKYVSA